MATVKRNSEGEITHILVGIDMMTKEDAFKVLHGSVDPMQVEAYLQKTLLSMTKLDLIEFIADILNEKETIHEYKKRILGFKK
jgi:hypothetical protein